MKTGRDRSDRPLVLALLSTPAAVATEYGRGERSSYVSGMFRMAPEATDHGAGH